MIAILNLIGLPADFFYSMILFLRNENEIEVYAKNMFVQIFAFANFMFFGLLSTFGIVFTILFQVNIWLYNIEHFSNDTNFSRYSMWDIMMVSI